MCLHIHHTRSPFPFPFPSASTLVATGRSCAIPHTCTRFPCGVLPARGKAIFLPHWLRSLLVTDCLLRAITKCPPSMTQCCRLENCDSGPRMMHRLAPIYVKRQASRHSVSLSPPARGTRAHSYSLPDRGKIPIGCASHHSQPHGDWGRERGLVFPSPRLGHRLGLYVWLVGVSRSSQDRLPRLGPSRFREWRWGAELDRTSSATAGSGDRRSGSQGQKKRKTVFRVYGADACVL